MVARVVGHISKAVLVFLFIVLAYQEAQARDLSVFAVFKELALTSKEAPQKDIYINGGTNDGISTGAIVDVYRRLPLHDPTTSRPVGDLQISVARLRVIHADRNVAVGRLLRTLGAKDRPAVDFRGVMVGDRIVIFDGEDEGEKGGSKGDRAEKAEKAEKTEKVEKTEKAEKSEKSEKVEATAAQMSSPKEAPIQLKAGEEKRDFSSKTTEQQKPAEIKVSL